MVVSNSKSGDTKWLHHCSGSRSWPTKGPQLLWNSGRFSSCSDSRGSSQLGSWDPHNEEPKLWLLREQKSSDVRAVTVKSYLLSTVQPADKRLKWASSTRDFGFGKTLKRNLDRRNCQPGWTQSISFLFLFSQKTIKTHPSIPGHRLWAEMARKHLKTDRCFRRLRTEGLDGKKELS